MNVCRWNEGPFPFSRSVYDRVSSHEQSDEVLSFRSEAETDRLYRLIEPEV